MKLKLEQQDPVTVLTITEEITPENIPVLKAGLQKLFKSGKEAILIDMSSIAKSDLKPPSTASDLAQLPVWAGEEGFDLLIASRIPEVSSIADRAKALEIFSSPVADLLLEESLLQATLQDLRRKKQALEEKLKLMKTDEVKVRRLQTARSKQRLISRILTQNVKKLATHRTESLLLKNDTREKLAHVLRPILIQQKLIMEKKA